PRSRLQRLRGHFYIWYDTRDLRPLDPQYISSVDSGNLAGHLIALANACREWATLPLTDEQRLSGVADALELLREEAGRLREGDRTQMATWRQVDEQTLQLAVEMERAAVEGEGLAKRLSVAPGHREMLVDNP